MLKMYQWINEEKNRFYKLTVNKNRKNEFILNYVWGSCTSNRGGRKSMVISSQQEVCTVLNKMIKRRKNRGYELIGNY